MSVRRKHRQGLTTWMSCPICQKRLAGTINWEKIPMFPRGKGLNEHIAKEHPDFIKGETQCQNAK